MAFFSDATLEEVRNSVNIVSVVSEYVALRKRGRNHVARCPFHNEKTPSFNVNEERQIFMCFGCHTGGDVFKFVMLMEHLTFPEAVRHIAERHGIVLREAFAPPEPSPDGIDPDALRAIMSEAAAWFHRVLLESREGKSALEYLAQRGITRETIDGFQLGFSPASGEALLESFVRKGKPARLLEECGLVKRSEDGERHYDAFRGRVMFPITDARGRVIAFGGRAMGDRQPKYLNSPETRIYNKSRNLFGLSYSREALKKQDCAVLVEGYMDFVIPFQYGVENLVASLGTSLTSDQVRLLGRYTHEVIVNYDPDSAGLSATQRSLDLFLEEDFKVKVLRLPEGEDPDTFVRRVGAAEYRARLRDAVPYLDFVIDSALQGKGAPDDPRKKVEVLNSVLPYLAKVPNAVERAEYVFRFARRLNVEDQQLLSEVKKAAQQRRTKLPEAPLKASGEMKFAEKRLLQLLLGSTALQPQVLPECSEQDFGGLAAEKIYAVILDRYQQGEISTFETLHRHFAGAPEQSVLARLQMEEVPESPTRQSADSYLSALRAMRLESYKLQINAGIADAASRNDNELVNRLIEQRVLVDRELVNLSRK
jgi:DNA primase